MAEYIQNLDDQQLLLQFKSTGESQFIGVLFKRYSLMVLGVCMKYLKDKSEAQDTTQQVFEKAFKELGKYEIPYFKSWIYTVARNICLMKLRSQSIHPESIDEVSDIPDDNSLLEQELKLREDSKEAQLMQLHDAMTQLSNEQNTCLKKFYFEKKSYQIIQEETGYSFQQVKSHIQNGKRMLKVLLDKKSLLHETD